MHNTTLALQPEFEMLFGNTAQHPSCNCKKDMPWVTTALNKVMGLRLPPGRENTRETRSALRSFQRRFATAVTGELNNETLALLNENFNNEYFELMNEGPVTARRMVDPKKVSCGAYPSTHAVIKAIGTADPAGLLEKICKRAVEALDNVIGILQGIKEKVAKGTDPAVLMDAKLRDNLTRRLKMDAANRIAWTGTGRRNAGLIIRWLSNIRKILAGGYLWYTCLDPDCTSTQRGAAIPGKYRIYLCRQFWNDSDASNAAENFDFQVQTLIHEASHIYYNTGHDSTGVWSADCIDEFVADINNMTVNTFNHNCG